MGSHRSLVLCVAKGKAKQNELNRRNLEQRKVYSGVQHGELPEGISKALY